MKNKRFRRNIFFQMCLVITFLTGCTQFEKQETSFVCNTKDYKGFYEITLIIEAKNISDRNEPNNLELGTILLRAENYLIKEIDNLENEQLKQNIDNRTLNKKTVDYLNSIEKFTSYNVKNVSIEVERLKKDG